jgi:hypothetical protein
MLKIGDKVKINVDKLDYEGLLPESNTTGVDYVAAIDTKKEYNIIDIITTENLICPYVLGDDVLKETSFCEEELILVK